MGHSQETKTFSQDHDPETKDEKLINITFSLKHLVNDKTIGNLRYQMRLYGWIDNENTFFLEPRCLGINYFNMFFFRQFVECLFIEYFLIYHNIH